MCFRSSARRKQDYHAFQIHYEKFNICLCDRFPYFGAVGAKFMQYKTRSKAKHCFNRFRG